MDNDGDLDLIINNIDREAFIYKNNADKLKNHNFLQIKLKGNTLNTAGLGTKVIIKNKGNIGMARRQTFKNLGFFAFAA